MLCPSTKQCTAVDKPLWHQETQISLKKSWKRQESNPGRLGEKQECYLCAMPTPHVLVSLASGSMACYPFKKIAFTSLVGMNLLRDPVKNTLLKEASREKNDIDKCPVSGGIWARDLLIVKLGHYHLIRMIVCWIMLNSDFKIWCCFIEVTDIEQLVMLVWNTGNVCETIFRSEWEYLALFFP